MYKMFQSYVGCRIEEIPIEELKFRYVSYEVFLTPDDAIELKMILEDSKCTDFRRYEELIGRAHFEFVQFLNRNYPTILKWNYEDEAIFIVNKDGVKVGRIINFKSIDDLLDQIKRCKLHNNINYN